MTSGVTDHIKLTISGETYGIKLAAQRGAYRELDINAFSPKMASGDLGYSDLSIWNVVAQEDFRHGFGHRKLDDPAGYHYSEGSIDTRHKDVVQLATRIVASDEDLANAVRQFVDYKGYVWAVSAGGLRVFDPGDSSWAAATDTDVDNEDCYALLNNGTYLFVARNGAQLVKTAAPGSPNPEAADFAVAGQASATDFRFLAMGGGRMWGAKDANAPYVHYATSADGSDWEGDSNDTNRIAVGSGDIPITGMQWFDNFMYVAREDGLWAVSTEDDIARQVLDWSNERRTTNGKGMMVWNDKLVIPVGPRLMAFTGSTISDITPPTIGSVFPYIAYGDFAALATFGPFLYAAAREIVGEGNTAPASQTLRPNAVGDESNMTPFGDSPNWKCVDEIEPDHYTTFVKNSFLATWKRDLYHIQNTSGLSGKTIDRVKLTAYYYAYSSVGADCYIKGAVKPSGGSVDEGTAFHVTANGWYTSKWEWALNPGDAQAWASGDIDALQVGASTSMTKGDCWITQLWVEVDYQESAVASRLICFDGSAWHNLGDLDMGGGCLWVSAEADKVWINDFDGDAGNYNTRYMKIHEHSFLPKDDYDTAGDTHILYTSRIDCGLKAVNKCFHNLDVHTENCTADRVITLHYRTTGQAWISLGDVTQSPIQTLDLSDIVGKYIDFKFVFDTDVVTQSPVLEAWALKFLARPETIYGYNITCDIGDSVRMLDGTINKEHGSRALRAALKSARDSSVPIAIENIWGETDNVLVSICNILDVRPNGKGGYEVMANLNLVCTS